MSNMRQQFIKYMKEEEYLQDLLDTPKEVVKKILNKYREEFIESNITQLYKRVKKYEITVNMWNKEAISKSLDIVEDLNFIRKISKNNKNYIDDCNYLSCRLHTYELELADRKEELK